MNTLHERRLVVGLILAFTLLSAAASTTSAQWYHYSPVGARSTGMGGTGIAIATSGESINSNPALLGLEGTYELSLAVQRRYEELNGPGSRYPVLYIGEHFGSHLASLVAPLPWQDKRLTFGIAQSRPMEPILYGQEWTGALNAYSPALSFRVYDRLRLGLAANIWSGTISYGGETRLLRQGAYTTIIPDITYSGFNVTGGAHFTVLEYYEQHKVFAGLTFRNGFDLEGDNGLPFTNLGTTQILDKNQALTIPSTVGVGAAWVINNRVTIAADYEFAFGREFPHVIPASPDTATVDYDLAYQLAEYQYTEKSTQLRLGCEYVVQLYGYEFPLRMGYRSFGTGQYNFDSSHVLGESLSVGLGIVRGPVRLDAAYEKVEYIQSGYAATTNPTALFAGYMDPVIVSTQVNTFLISASVNIEELW